MKTEVEIWTVDELYKLKDEINEQPRYQRGGVWLDSKKSLLIDSMLREIDMPKIYLHEKKKGHFKYEVADGQQRITSILRFREDKLKLRDDKILGLDLNKLGRFKIGGKSFSELPENIQVAFGTYKLTIAIIKEATQDEVRTLFGRLQLGETLTPAEKRNAILCEVGNDINTIALTSDFFKKTKIKKERFNHQDYVAHALTLIAYNNKQDLKAVLIQEMYLDDGIKWTMEELKKVNRILDIMNLINTASKKKIEKKFAFLDIFWFLYKADITSSEIDVVSFAEHYDQFEADRKKNYKYPENLLGHGERAKDLYDYIMAFRFEGLRAINYAKRSNIILKEFSKFLLK